MNDPKKEIEKVEEKAFNGYSIEEIRYQKAMMALRKEFCKAKVLESVHHLRPAGPLKLNTGNSKWALAARLATKLFSNMNTLDYVLMGISLFGTAKKGYRLIRRKKK